MKYVVDIYAIGGDGIQLYFDSAEKAIERASDIWGRLTPKEKLNRVGWVYEAKDFDPEEDNPQDFWVRDLWTPGDISLDNGMTYQPAAQAWPEIQERGLWDAIVEMMDDDIRERVHNRLAPCSEVEFLEAYLKEAKTPLIIG